MYVSSDDGSPSHACIGPASSAGWPESAPVASGSGSGSDSTQHPAEATSASSAATQASARSCSWVANDWCDSGPSACKASACRASAPTALASQSPGRPPEQRSISADQRRIQSAQATLTSGIAPGLGQAYSGGTDCAGGNWDVLSTVAPTPDVEDGCQGPGLYSYIQ